MNLDGAEPQAGPWRILSLVELTALLLDVSAPPVDRPRIVAVDGRSASGKTMLARRLNGVVPRSAVVHTDDIAWLSEEIPFVADQRPWERARIVVSGTPDEEHNPDTHAVVADPPT